MPAYEEDGLKSAEALPANGADGSVECGARVPLASRAADSALLATPPGVVPIGGANPRRVAILGLGLMGGSLGMALRERGRVVVGYDGAPGIAARARTLGAVDVACGSVADVVAGADLVVLAAPVLASRDLLAAAAPHLAPGAVVTDLGSTKAHVVAWADELLPDSARFIGGHPMTGRERSGVEAAEPGLYAGCVWCLTPTERTAPSALASVQALITSLGAHPLVMDAAEHDAAVAAVSHLPLLAAAALTIAATNSPAWEVGQRLAAGGFRDTTRVASGDPRMARDICLTNRDAILASLDDYLGALRQLRERVAAGDTDIEADFAAAKSLRDAWMMGAAARDAAVSATAGGEPPEARGRVARRASDAGDDRAPPGVFDIRRATMDDFEGVSAVFAEVDRLHVDAHPEIFRPTPGPARPREHVAAILASDDAALFVAAAGGRIVGAVTVEVREARDIPLLVPRRWAEVDTLVVAETHRGQGIGRALMRAAEEWAGDKGLPTIELGVWEFNAPAIALYERLGYGAVRRALRKSLG